MPHRRTSWVGVALSSSSNGACLKPSPDHIQVVGPTLFGKSVFLNGLAERLRGNTSYIATAYVDLRHAPPSDDASFRKRFAEVVKKALVEANASEADYIDTNDERLHEWLDLAFQDLERRQARLLVILDGFDHVLAGVGITRNLWDQLRSLAQKIKPVPCHRKPTTAA